MTRTIARIFFHPASGLTITRNCADKALIFLTAQRPESPVDNFVDKAVRLAADRCGARVSAESMTKA
jgi:hypothetical protein